MKLFLIGILVLAFVALPLYALNDLVMPQLQSMKGIYGNMDGIAQRASGAPNAR